MALNLGVEPDLAVEPEPEGLVADDGSRVSRQIFYDPNVYEQERVQIFQRCWLFVAHESQLPNAGDFVTSFMGEEPVIVTRTVDGDIRVVVNSCSHRGMRLCRAEAGNTDSFTCPFHGWQYANDGRLVGVPRLSSYNRSLDKSKWGLHSAAQVATCRGLIFATFDPDAPALEEYLGEDFLFYLDLLFARDEQGMTILGPVHRGWLLDCNWKFPAENLSGDLYHGNSLHAVMANLGLFADDVLDTVQQVTTSQGHAFSFQALPEGAGPEAHLAYRIGPPNPLIAQFLEAQQPQATERLGPVRAQLEPFVGGIFPNLGFFWPSFALRVDHPRGPGQTEVWTWSFTPKAASDEVRHAYLSSFGAVMGPGALIEPEDADTWIGATLGARDARTQHRPYHVGLGAGEEHEDPSMPGTLAPAWSEHNQRGFYRNWKRWMEL